MKTWTSPIPKHIHLIWIGNKEPPDYLKLFLKSFIKHLPGFKIKIWRNKDLNRAYFPITYDYIQNAKNKQDMTMYDYDEYRMYDEDMNTIRYSKWAQITDLMRLEAVYHWGGYYFDTTFEILKPLTNILNRHETFVGCNEYPFKHDGILSNSFFGATVHNPILKRMLKKNVLNKIDFDAMDVGKETGPGFLGKYIYKSDSFHIFPFHYFYPFMERWSENTDVPYRRSGKNKCHSTKKKKSFKRLKNKKGYIEYPCKKYPRSYALKHWQLGKSWTAFLNYYIKDTQ
jgi:mannosyltransferase OCH1-like enzyme